MQMGERIIIQNRYVVIFRLTGPEGFKLVQVLGSKIFSEIGGACGSEVFN